MTCCQVQEATCVLQGLYILDTTGLPFNQFLNKIVLSHPDYFTLERNISNIMVEVRGKQHVILFEFYDLLVIITYP